MAVFHVNGLQNLQKVPQELRGCVLCVEFTLRTVQLRLWTNGQTPPQKQLGIVGIAGDQKVT